MTWKVMIEEDFGRDGIAIHAGDAYRDVIAVLQPMQLVLKEQMRETAAATSEPALRLPHGLGRALLDALSAHYGGTGDTRTLRRDYDAERARVDRLIGHLTAGSA